MVGGTTSGYCAMGRPSIATRPMMTMTIESTVAKTGRSTKNRANMGPRLGRRRRQHVGALGLHGHAGARALDAVGDHPFAGPQTLGDDAQPALGRGAELHGPIFDHVLVADDEQILVALIASDRPLADQELRLRIAERNAHPDEETRREQMVRIVEDPARLDRSGRRI